MFDLLSFLGSLSRKKKKVISIIMDFLFLHIAFFSALIVRFDELASISQSTYWLASLLLSVITLIVFYQIGLYRAVIRYLGSSFVWPLMGGALFSFLTLIAIAFTLQVQIPRTVPVIYVCFLIIAVGGSRMLLRMYVSTFKNHSKKLVVIYGAGSAGRQLATALKEGPEFKVLCFIDDDVAKHNSSIQGLRVHGNEKLEEIIKRNTIAKILLAVPSAKRSMRKKILSHLEKYPVEVLTIPGMADVVEGKASLDDFKEVEIEDLLGRDAVDPKLELLTKDITNKIVMITGAGGSIGSELCRQILRQNPKKLVLFELSEFALYAIDKELNGLKIDLAVNTEILPIMGSVQRQMRLERVFSSFKVQTVYHAAAYKHVPLVENNAVEGVRNNIFGTMRTAQAAMAANVETFVLISTDKAVRPTNVMGTTKRMAELVLQALAKEQSNTRFCMVRFGNVLGSSGSVVPLFRKQIKAGGPVTLTHPDITRFFMTIPEAAQLVIQAGAMGKGGDVFVLDMGDSVKIKDLATKMIRLSGYEVKDENDVDGDIEIKCTGLRPGEKLYEELLIGDNVSGTTHERIMTANEVMLDWSDLEIMINELDNACTSFDNEKIRQILLEAPTGFNPTDGICDLVWQAQQAN